MSDVRWRAYASTVERTPEGTEVVKRELGDLTAPDRWAALREARRRWGVAPGAGEISVTSHLELEAQRYDAPRRTP